ncbi:hypothetical protein AB1N83_006217 [Pleurotus pulmonarius]
METEPITVRTLGDQQASTLWGILCLVKFGILSPKAAFVEFPNTEADSELSASYTQTLSLTELEYTLAFPANIMWRWHPPLRILA